MLLDFINKDIFQYITDVAKGMQYLHRNSIVHSCLRGDSVLIGMPWMVLTKDDKYVAVLTNFNISCIQRVFAVNPKARSCRYSAPELLCDPSQKATSGSDVFAFAMLCIEVLQDGAAPFS